MRRNKLPKQLKYQLKSLTKFPMMLNYKSKKILMMLSMNTNKMLNFQCYLNSSCYFRSQNPTPTSNNEMFPSIKPFTTAYKVLSKGESESYTMSHKQLLVKLPENKLLTQFPSSDQCNLQQTWTISKLPMLESPNTNMYQ